MPFGMHYQFCATCGHSAMEDDVKMKVCPCHEAFYCSKACQNDDWAQHKVTCTYRLQQKQGKDSRKVPMGDEALFLLKHFDADLVEMAIAAMGPDANLIIETEMLAATFFLAARSPESGLPNPVGGWWEDLMQPFCIEKVVVGPAKEQAQRFGLDRDFLEDPIQRQKRLFHGDHAMLNVSIVFEPTGIFITKNVPRVQLSIWEIIQEREKTTTNPPRLHFLRHVTNGTINSRLREIHDKRDPKAGVSCRSDFRETQDNISTTDTNESAPTIMAPCGVCGTPSATKCSLCHIVHYCSPEHIESDWPSHKIDCYVRPPKNAREDRTTYEISGIFFPEDEDAPRMIKVKSLGGHTVKGKWWQTLNLKPYIPDDEKKGRGHVIMDGAVVLGEGGTSSGYLMGVFFRSGFLQDGSKINRCIQHLTKGQMAMPWAGPFIAFRHADVIGSLSAVMDEELPPLIQYFKTGMTGPITALIETRKSSKKKR